MVFILRVRAIKVLKEHDWKTTLLDRWGTEETRKNDLFWQNKINLPIMTDLAMHEVVVE